MHPFVDDVPRMRAEADLLLRASQTDRLGGSSPAQWTLQQKHVFPRPSPIDPEMQARIWAQLKQFRTEVEPSFPTLAKFPHLFWILPVPFDLQQPRANWIVQMRAYGCFLSMIHNGQSQQLELALMAYYSPEIERNFGLLELVSTQKASVSRRDRLKRLMAAWMCLHVLSVPVPGSHILPLASSTPQSRYLTMLAVVPNAPLTSKKNKNKKPCMQGGYDALGGGQFDSDGCSSSRTLCLIFFQLLKKVKLFLKGVSLQLLFCLLHTLRRERHACNWLR